MVLFPALDDEQRKPYARIRGSGPSTPYNNKLRDRVVGFTRSALLGMVTRGFDIVETLEEPRGSHCDDLIDVLRRRS